MESTITTILKILCSRPEMLPGTKAQLLYVLEDAKQAKLACELLQSFGFDTKIYFEDHIAKLYIGVPASLDDAILPAAQLYAQNLADMQRAADSLCKNPLSGASNFAISIVNDVEKRKKISLQFSPLESAKSASNGPAPKLASKLANAENPVQKNAQNSRPAARQATILDSGPEVMRPSFIRNKKRLYDQNPDTLWKKLNYYLKGNIASALYYIGLWLVALIIAISLYRLGVSAMCPDLAQVKSSAWYCQ